MVKTHKINKERFLYLKENIGLLNNIVHSGTEFDTIFMVGSTPISENKVDVKMTEEVRLLKKAVERFEKETGLELSVG